MSWSSSSVDSLNVRSALMSLLLGVGVISSSPNLVRDVSTVFIDEDHLGREITISQFMVQTHLDFAIGILQLLK